MIDAANIERIIENSLEKASSGDSLVLPISECLLYIFPEAMLK